MDEIAGFVAEYHGSDQTLCYGFGETKAIARMRVNYQLSGASPLITIGIKERIIYRAVGPDEASEILEMLDTPW